MSEEPKPCPFCGGDANAEQTDEGNWFVFCFSEGDCYVRPQAWGSSYDEAVAAWNTRPVEDELRAKWDAIPWLALRILVCDPKDWPTSYEEVQSRVDKWIVADAPAID